MYEEKIAQLEQQLKDEHARVENAKEQLHAIEEQFTDHETSTKVKLNNHLTSVLFRLSIGCDPKHLHDLHCYSVDEVD